MLIYVIHHALVNEYVFYHFSKKTIAGLSCLFVEVLRVHKVQEKKYFPRNRQSYKKHLWYAKILLHLFQFYKFVWRVE